MRFSEENKAPRRLRTAGMQGEGRLPWGGDISADTMGEGLGSAGTWRQETHRGVHRGVQRENEADEEVRSRRT